MPGERATLASKKRALILGAQFIENDLADMRQRIQREYHRVEGRTEGTAENPAGRVQPFPVTTSHEGDFLKATEWASAATWLRALAEMER